METTTFKAETRTAVGTRAARALRETGRLPAVIYGHGEAPESVSLPFHEVEVALSHGARTLEVELSGAEHVTSNEADEDMGYFPGDFKSRHLLEFLGEEVRQAVDALPERHRRTLIMADLQDMSYKEIAEEMECPLGTVMSRLHRGRRLMRDSLPAQVREMAYG